MRLRLNFNKKKNIIRIPLEVPLGMAQEKINLHIRAKRKLNTSSGNKILCVEKNILSDYLDIYK